MADLKSILAGAAPSFPRIEQLKALPILYVLELAGVEYEETADGVYTARNPFRVDNNPSFDVYGEDLDRWGDFAENRNGDVLDLVGRFLEKYTGKVPSIQDVKDETARLLGKYQESGWAGPQRGAKRKSFDLEAARLYVAETQAEHFTTVPAVYEWQQSRSHRSRLREVPTDWLVERFNLGWDGTRIMVPYYDRDGVLMHYKTRRPGEAIRSAAGVDNSGTLYGLDLDDGFSPVVLCEGESDVWSGTHAVPQGYVFLGVPTGAGANPRQAFLLTGRRVIVAFDGDETGRNGTLKWAEKLSNEPGTEVLIAYIPDGEDLDSMSAEELRVVLSSALPLRPMPQEVPTVMAGNAGYERQQGKQTSQITDWVFVPKQVLVGDDGVAWNGMLYPHGAVVTLRANDLSSKAAVVKWSEKNGVSWLGSERDAQLLVSMYYAQSTLLPRGRAVPRTGLHDGIIVYPGGRLGNADYVYVPGKIDIPLDKMVQIHESLAAEPAPGIPLALRELHGHEVMDPILAWLAVAPLRSKLQQFPILAVTGGSGTGKTTLLRETIRHFTATSIGTNLTGTTKFAMLGFLGSTNAFPVWFDEYRPGARKDTLTEFNQLLRDAYTGQSSIKGGMGDHWATVRETPVTAPIVVSGEDSFTEVSHTERMVLVHLPRDGKNRDAMAGAIAAPISGFAADYFDWVRTAVTPSITPEGPIHLPDRQRHNLGVLRAGWELLATYLDERLGVDLGAPDWSLVIAEGEEAAVSNPILDAIRWALEEPRLRQDYIVFPDPSNGRIHVRVASLVNEVNRAGAFNLPGGSKAVSKYIKTHLGGKPEQISLDRMGQPTRLRTFSIPAEVLHSEDDLTPIGTRS